MIRGQHVHESDSQYKKNSMTDTVFSHFIFGSDHAGILMRRHLMNEAQNLNHRFLCEEVGPSSLEEVSHYPDIANQVIAKIKSKNTAGVLLCGTGIGMSIAANRIKGVRAALCHDVTTARLCRQHNDANILILGARLIGFLLAQECFYIFASTAFQGGRHQGRIEMLDKI